MIKKLQAILAALFAPGKGKPFTGIDIRDQFLPDESGDNAIFRNLNAAFLLTLCGPSQPLYERAMSYLSAHRESGDQRDAAEFYLQGRKLVPEEFLDRCSNSEDFRKRLSSTYVWIRDSGTAGNKRTALSRIWQIFFPEGVAVLEDRGNSLKALRKKRTVRVTRLNPSPLKDPGRELLFTSNVLLTIPSGRVRMETLPFSKKIRKRMEQVQCESQVFWYDHPVQLGADPGKNEVLYGLQGLDEAVAFEKKKGTLGSHLRVSCALSISVTHRGLQSVAKECLQEMLAGRKKLNHLKIVAFTEADTRKLVSDILYPAALHYFPYREAGLLEKIIGVDGEYGRHYSFLKAIAAFWQVFVDPGIRGTFKIDLDQVFPQYELVNGTGLSAFEHFMSPLWGAEGVDSTGRQVRLGMIAGTLVNREDARESLFRPDVTFPSGDVHGDEWIFHSRFPQALSTEAEMMARYDSESLDGRHSVLQRVHVTGGTTGILVKDLRKYRPFTPGIVGRAEDQAYLLALLGRDSSPGLRYLHKDGLVMRHDKEAFAVEAMHAGATGKLVGDYIRTLTFSRYAEALPGGINAVKAAVDPFTGCFISRIPLTVVYLRFALKAASGFQSGNGSETVKLAKMGSRRIGKAIEDMVQSENGLKEHYEAEREAWHLYYDILERMEQGLKEQESYALKLRERGRGLLDSMLVHGRDDDFQRSHHF